MPDRRTHRGPHPEDERLFAREQWPRLQAAAADLCWLLDGGYAIDSSLKLVGDRHELTKRQRIAVARCCCSAEAKQRREEHCVPLDTLRGEGLLLDGYNVLTTIEAALAGGVIIAGRDGCYRDMASVHGSYRKVAETLPALKLLGEFLAQRDIVACRWYLDRPVSNSGRLKTIISELAAQRDWPWQVELVDDPDRVLKAAEELVATSDSAILDACHRWVKLAREVVAAGVPQAYVVDLSGGESAVM